ncbi:MIZ/SP-RING zinc finger domain-containing protein [Ditylenchus destructor]|uniref:MIZ/SP-RING zinc finger domain-containing protein n=1 Tax=Ditylenchus destructor TaxID=166010 RepID=A0AAD4QYV8_9BILA|nr:MIZ/SP-RING zinc finger domain-containing protein [Ditylenchus destructor]
MAESPRRYNLRNTSKKPQGMLLKRWQMEYSKLISNQNRRIPLETVKTAIHSAFEDGMFEQWRITLKCPLSGQRIKVPARYADCTHIECFDLEAFLRMKTQKNLLVCPICQKEVEKPLTNLRIDTYIETVLSTQPHAMQVELLSDGSFTEVFEEFVVVPNVINDEEPFVQDSNAPSFNVKQEVLEDADEFITLSNSEDGYVEEIAIVETKPISFMPLNMDIKPKITSSSVPEQVHSGEDQEIQGQQSAAAQNANIPRRKRNFSGGGKDESETVEPEDADTSGVEFLGTNKRKAQSKSTGRSGGSIQQNVESDGECSNLRQLKKAKTNVDTPQILGLIGTRDQEERIAILTTLANFANRIHVFGPCLHPTDANPIDCQREDIQTYFGQFGKILNVSVKKILDDMATSMVVTFDHRDSAAKCIEQDDHKILGQNFRVEGTATTKDAKRKIIADLEQNMLHLSNGAMLVSSCVTNRISIRGPCLHPEQVDPIESQKEDLRTYFCQFGRIATISSRKTYENIGIYSKITFHSWDSAATYVKQGKHVIAGQDFIVDLMAPTKCMKEKIRANLRQGIPGISNEFTPVTINQNGLLAESNHSNQISSENGKNAEISFRDCDSAAKCLQQDTHRICGHDFLVRKETPTKSTESTSTKYMKKKKRLEKRKLKEKLRANLVQNMPGPSSENTSVPGIQSNTLAESNFGNQLPKATTSSSPTIHWSVMDCRAWPQSHMAWQASTNQISSRKTYENIGIYSKITFHSWDSAATYVKQGKHVIAGQDFIVDLMAPTKCMKEKIRANLRQGIPGISNEFTPVTINQNGLLAESNHSNQISSENGKNAEISFRDCDSAAKCLQQDTHRICGHDFLVRKETPTKSTESTSTKYMKKKKRLEKRKLKEKLRANLVQNMPGPSSENTSVPGIQSNTLAESNFGNQLPKATTSSSPTIHWSVMDCRAWPQSHMAWQASTNQDTNRAVGF